MSGQRTVGARIAWGRTRLGWSPGRLAHEAGVTPAYVSMLESGKRQPSYEALLALARVLQMTPSALLEGVR